MTTHRFFVRLLVVPAILAAAPRAHAGPCDDAIGRHSRRDLAPVALSFIDRRLSGDIYAPNQVVTLRVKNVGEVAVGGGMAGLHSIALNLDGKAAYGSVMLPVESGAEAQVTIYLDGQPLHACQYYDVALDTERSIGQWGCGVFNNDAATLRAYVPGVFCRLPADGPVRPLPPPDFGVGETAGDD